MQEICLHRTFDGERKIPYFDADGNLSFAAVKRNADLSGIFACRLRLRRADGYTITLIFARINAEQKLHSLALILCKKSRKSAVFRLCRNFVPQKVFCVRHNVNVFDVDQLLFILFFASGDDCERKYRNKNCCHCLFHGFSPFPLYAFSSLFFLSSASLFEKTHPQ